METILALLDALSRDLARANTGLRKINLDVVTLVFDTSLVIIELPGSSCFADCFEWFLLKWPIERNEAMNLWANSSQDGEDDIRIITDMVLKERDQVIGLWDLNFVGVAGVEEWLHWWLGLVGGIASLWFSIDGSYLLGIYVSRPEPGPDCGEYLRRGRGRTGEILEGGDWHDGEAELFNVLREKIDINNLNSLVKEKVFPVAGDISFEDFGIENSEMKDEMLKEIDIVIHSAATTRFDERYHIAMNINVLGAANVLKFAKRSANVKILVHVYTGHYFYVSLTSYVCGEREREEVIQEKSFNFEDSYIDIDVERKVIEDKLKDLEAQNLSSKEVTMAMRDLGIQRATLHGWPNTYSFTKAMGEMMLGHLKENLQLVIIRPTIITSTYKEPFPGWIEEVK
ncbi:putative fatty acyl-CoA reductase 5 [Capsicum chinense]|nr:putative fatty acyl-CoA reductase 5 [Capsicum chinense]